MMRPRIGENGKLIMTRKGDSVEDEAEDNRRMIESILFGTTETVGVICEYRNLLKKVDDCKEIFSYDIKGRLTVPPPSVQFDDNEVSRYDTTFQPRHVAMLLEKFIQIERLSMVDIPSFIFVIEDLTVLSKEASLDKGIFLPDAWINLNSSHLSKFCNLIMVQRGYINWKNFLIACMNLPYPTQTDILDILSQFRTLDPAITNCVDKNKFDLVTLWFESIDPAVIAYDLTSLRWRECLYQLFADSFNFFQYVEFLLYFCKDLDPRIGLANSLALLTGHVIPIDELQGLDPQGKDDLRVTDSELEMIFSQEDLLIEADFNDGSAGSREFLNLIQNSKKWKFSDKSESKNRW